LGKLKSLLGQTKSLTVVKWQPIDLRFDRDKEGWSKCGTIAYKELDGELLMNSKEFDFSKVKAFKYFSINTMAEITVSVMHRWKITGYKDIFEIADDFVEDYLRKFGDAVVFAKADIELKKNKYQKQGGNLQ